MDKKHMEYMKKHGRYMDAGRRAFQDGKPRMPPETFVNGAKPGAIRMWFLGYDLEKYISENYQPLTDDVQ